MLRKAHLPDFASVDTGAALTTLNRVLPPWVSLLLVVIIGWQVGRIVWTLVPAPAAGDLIEAPAATAASASASGTLADVEAIAANHMFGEASAVAENVELVPAAEIDDNLADTRLTNLVLKGTIASAIPEWPGSTLLAEMQKTTATWCRIS